MKRLCILILITSLFTNSNFAQSDHNNEPTENKNFVYGTIGWFPMYGTFAINYERNILKPNRKLAQNINLRFAYGRYWSWGIGGPYYITSLHTLSGKGNNHFEASIGVGIIFDNEGWSGVKYDNLSYPENESNPTFLNYTYPTPVISFGYRYHNPNKRFMFRTGAGWPETIYLSFGYAF